MMSIEDQDKVTTATQTGIEEADQVIFLKKNHGTNSINILAIDIRLAPLLQRRRSNQFQGINVWNY